MGFSSYRVALVHDWLNGMRGGEKVLEYLCGLFPNSEIFTLHCDKSMISSLLQSKVIHCSTLQHMPFRKKYYRYYLPLFPWFTKTLHLEGFDLVISTSHCAAKNVRVPQGVPHICYCFSPMRYVFELADDYFGVKSLKRAFFSVPLSYIKRWDIEGSKHVTQFIGISQTTCERIYKHYRRDAWLIYPPCDLPFEYSPHKENYYLVLSALVPYKRIDLAIEAVRKTGVHLKIAGRGPLMEALQKKAPSNVEFLGWVGDEEKKRLLKHAKALLFPGLEDFGIVPLEALSFGTPVIAYGKGGVTETVQHEKTGVFFKEQSAQDLVEAMEKCDNSSFREEDFREGLKPFSLATFHATFEHTLQTFYQAL